MAIASISSPLSPEEEKGFLALCREPSKAEVVSKRVLRNQQTAPRTKPKRNVIQEPQLEFKMYSANFSLKSCNEPTLATFGYLSK